MQTIQIQLESTEKFEQMVKLLEKLRVDFSFWTDNNHPPVPNSAKNVTTIRPNPVFKKPEDDNWDEIIGFIGDGEPISDSMLYQMLEESVKGATKENCISNEDLLAEVEKW